MFLTQRVLGSIIVLTLVWSMPVVYAQDLHPEPQIDPYIALFGGIAMPFNTDRRVDDNTLGVSIANRSPEVEDRAVPGHWEGDLIAGRGNTHIATLVERHSRFTMLVKVMGKDTKTVVTALSTHVRKLPDQLRQSLTWDRGMELADHKTFTLATDTQVYFCDLRSPWQRGTNENTNRLLRQYFPKGTDLSAHSQTELNRIAQKLNQRPRKILGYATPAEQLQASVALTG